VLREKGMDFASIIRSFLRQDPDVILISEMRDKETAKTGIEAVLANHLVLTRLYANDAASAIAHLKRIGVEPFMIAEALIGVITQRLIRRVCFDCRIPYHPSASELAKFGWSTSGEGVLTLYKANTLQPEEMQEAKAKGTLCQTCNGVGYKGRIGVYEMMHISERLQTLITEAASTEQIREAAIEEGITTLLTDSLAMVRNGYTTLAEVERLTFTDSHLEAELKAKQYNPLSHYSSQKISGKDPSIDPLYQLQELEKHLEELTHQFQQLKQQLKT
jgi:type IV pilus assembly protein PilB